MAWGENCKDHCNYASTQGEANTVINLVSVPSATAPEALDLTSSVPSCYHHRGEVFNKTKAMSLPPHRPYDWPLT